MLNSVPVQARSSRISSPSQFRFFVRRLAGTLVGHRERPNMNPSAPLTIAALVALSVSVAVVLPVVPAL